MNSLASVAVLRLYASLQQTKPLPVLFVVGRSSSSSSLVGSTSSACFGPMGSASQHDAEFRWWARNPVASVVNNDLLCSTTEQKNTARDLRTRRSASNILSRDKRPPKKLVAPHILRDPPCVPMCIKRRALPPGLSTTDHGALYNKTHLNRGYSRHLPKVQSKVFKDDVAAFQRDLMCDSRYKSLGLGIGMHFVLSPKNKSTMCF